jgi:hypothetical protein
MSVRQRAKLMVKAGLVSEEQLEQALRKLESADKAS